MSLNRLYHDHGIAQTRAAHAPTHTLRADYAAEALLAGERIITKQGDHRVAGQMQSDHFDVFRTDEVRLTSTQFSGGDWHWRLTDPGGSILVEGTGYQTERECLDAVALLRKRASSASLSRSHS